MAGLLEIGPVRALCLGLMALALAGVRDDACANLSRRCSPGPPGRRALA